MIKKIEVANFRNLKYLELTLDQSTSIITGANNIGKSNTLNAIHWFLTNKLLTDKWGTGESELDSIVPIDMKKGEHTQVSITTESGAVFTKYYKTQFDRQTGKPNKHVTEYKINGVAYSNALEWQEQLFKELNYTPKLKCSKDVDESRLFTDPLYALQKIDDKARRILLVALGCSVTDEEVFEKYPQYLKLTKYADKYLKDYTKMRQALKTDRLDLINQLEGLESVLENYKDVVEFDPTNKDKLEAQRDDISSKIRSLRKGDVNLTNEVELEIQKITSDKNLYVANIKAQNSQNLAVLNEKLKVAKEEANSAKTKQLNSLNEKLRTLYEKKSSLDTAVKAYESTRNTKKEECINLKKKAQEADNKIQANKDKLEEIQLRQFVGYVKCPDCGKIFAPDVAALTLFNKQKQDDIANLIKENGELSITIEEAQKQFEVSLTQGKQAKEEQEETQKKVDAVLEEIDTVNSDILKVSSEEVDLSKVKELETQIASINHSIDTSEYDKKLSDLENQKQNILISAAQENEKVIAKLEEELTPIKEAIENEYLLKSKYNSKLEFENKYDDVTAKLNDTEELLELVHGFIQKRISMINDKAKDITGIDFVMLEENLVNDNLKEICRATVDGVDFNNVNTSTKLKVGIQFIHRIKEILGANDLPILADRMEGFDSLDKIRTLTSEQMICTYVGEESQKEITII